MQFVTAQTQIRERILSKHTVFLSCSLLSIDVDLIDDGPNISLRAKFQTIFTIQVNRMVQNRTLLSIVVLFFGVVKQNMD